MLNEKVRELYNLNVLNEERQKAAEISLSEAIYCCKNNRQYGMAQNIDLFFHSIGANKLSEADLQDFLDKTKFVVEILARDENVDRDGVINKLLFKWDNLSESKKTDNKPVKTDQYYWKDSSGLDR